MNRYRCYQVTMIFGIMGLLGACAGSPGPQHEIQSVDLGSTSRVHKVSEDNIYVASQPGENDFRTIRDRGVKTVLNLRPPAETPELDEQQVVEDLGMSYYNPGFSSPSALNDQIFDRVRMILVSSERPLFLHCSSANRASTVWLAYEVLDREVSLSTALKDARKMGLRSKKLEQKAIEYIKRNQENASDHQ